MNNKVVMICVSIVLGLVNCQVAGMGFETELFEGAQTGSLALLENALTHGAPLQAADSKGMTALHMAAAGGHVACLRALLDRGAQIEAKDNWKVVTKKVRSIQ